MIENRLRYCSINNRKFKKESTIPPMELKSYEGSVNPIDYHINSSKRSEISTNSYYPPLIYTNQHDKIIIPLEAVSYPYEDKTEEEAEEEHIEERVEDNLFKRRMYKNNKLNGNNKGDIMNILNGNMILNKIKEHGEIQISNIIKNHFGFEFYFNIRNNIIRINKDFIKKYDSKFNKRKKDFEGCLINTEFIMKLEPQTFCYVAIGSFSISTDEVIRIGGIFNQRNIHLYVFGKKSLKYKKIIENILEEDKDLSIYDISTFKDRENENNLKICRNKMISRSFDTLFYDDMVKEKIIRHIDKYLNSQKIYTKRSINYKTGILLYGEPGTGKSSLVKAISSKYDIDLVIIDMQNLDKLDLNTLTSYLNADDKTYIVLLEDIDCICLDRSNVNIDKEDRRAVNKLLQFLDSNSSPNNVIFIATTNHVEKLDEALLRNGRFDLKVNVPPLNSKEEAIIMAKSFNLSDNTVEDILKDEKYPINQSYLQSKIMSRL